jgi:5-methylcytosine-specific restriction endonuclease McrA
MSWGGRRVQKAWREVAGLHGSVCWICEEPIITTGLPPRHRLGPSVDHVVPRSKGGSDHIANLRPAHLGCNSRRGNRSSKPRRIAESRMAVFLTTPQETPPAASKNIEIPTKKR